MNKLTSLIVNRFALLAIAASIVGLGLGVAPAAHAQATIGSITTAQVSCGPLGANVAVNVSSGLSNTTYTAGAGLSLVTIPAIFTTNATGSGSGTVVSVPLPLGGVGNIQLPVIAGSQMTTVNTAVSCPAL